MGTIKDSREVDAPKRDSVILPSTGSIRDIERPDDEIIPVVADGTGEYADALAFMEELVEVNILKGQQKTDELFVQLGSNGVTQLVKRGEWKAIRRKFVHVLCRASVETISTDEFINEEGARDIRINRSVALKYPFQTRNDTPRGNAWLQAELAGG
jgi:hypothetical protein